MVKPETSCLLQYDEAFMKSTEIEYVALLPVACLACLIRGTLERDNFWPVTTLALASWSELLGPDSIGYTRLLVAHY